MLQNRFSKIKSGFMWVFFSMGALWGLGDFSCCLWSSELMVLMHTWAVAAMRSFWSYFLVTKGSFSLFVLVYGQPSAKYSVGYEVLAYFFTTICLPFLNYVSYSARRNRNLTIDFFHSVCRNNSISDIIRQLLLLCHCAVLTAWRQVAQWTLRHLIRLTRLL